MVLDTGTVLRARPSVCRLRYGAPRTSKLVAALTDYYRGNYIEDKIGLNGIKLSGPGISFKFGLYGPIPYFDGSGTNVGTGPRSLNLLYNQPFTISLTGSVVAGGTKTFISCINSSASTGWSFQCSGNSVYFSMYAGSGVYQQVHNAGYSILSSTATKRITVSYSGNGHTSGFKFYQNGSLLSSNVSDHDGIGTGSTSTTNVLTVGQQDGGSVHYGTVGDILIWLRQLSDSEILLDFADPFAPVRPRRLDMAFPYLLSLTIVPS
ncbi:MAG TPA: hypothetical protein VJ508_02985, partial [Saprospiraceae bacterium]|nr:hypothetical protein [Saprospiraceae bacterium]